MKKYNFYFLLLLTLLFSACVNSIPTVQERKEKVGTLITDKNYLQKNIKTSSFNIFSLEKNLNGCKNIRVYIEGDGLSWISRNVISQNPTPVNPVALYLMNEDLSQCKIYLARPCQYVDSMQCDKRYWTSHRFNSEIIQSYNEVLDDLKTQYKNSNFILIGFSGGAAIAGLISSSRNDVMMFISVAGNLDTNKWTTLHNISKLDASLNPADFTKELESIEQYHLIGSNDEIIPKDIFLSYFSKFDKKDKIHVLYYEQNHNCCWENPFKKLLLEIK